MSDNHLKIEQEVLVWSRNFFKKNVNLISLSNGINNFVFKIEGLTPNLVIKRFGPNQKKKMESEISFLNLSKEIDSFKIVSKYFISKTVPGSDLAFFGLS